MGAGLLAPTTSRTAWAAAQTVGQYRAPSPDTQGFIHCPRPDEAQLLAVADFLYRGQPGLVLLPDPARLHAQRCREEFGPGSARFPHVCGPVNLDAVTAVLALMPGPDGRLQLPGTSRPG